MADDKINPKTVVRADNYINNSQRDATPANDEGRVPKLESDGKLHDNFIPFVEPIITAYTKIFGDSTTQFDITNPAGSTFRYTWDATGTNPNISLTTVPVGTRLYINGQNFSAGNKGHFVVTGAGANYFEITNAAGVAENDKTLGTGAINYSYSKPTGLKCLKVKVQAGGGGSGSTLNGVSASGAGGGYTEGIIDADDLAENEIITVGKGGNGGVYPNGGENGGASSFGSHLVANGGGASAHEGSSSTGGTVPTPGYFYMNGANGGAPLTVSAGTRLLSPPGMSYLSRPSPQTISTCTDCDFYGPGGIGYGYGGGQVGQDSQPSGINGQAGGGGIVIIEEIFN